MSKDKMLFIALLLAVFMAGCSGGSDSQTSNGSASANPSAVSLGSAGSFAVLAGSAIANTGTTTIWASAFA